VLRALGRDARPLLEREAAVSAVRAEASRVVAAVQALCRAERSARRERASREARLAHRERRRALRPEGKHGPASCYCCQRRLSTPATAAPVLCAECVELNRRKRERTADLGGRGALVTGARIKIGYQVALRLLRAGASVIGTTRFPRDAARRFAAEPDFTSFAKRLELHGLDLRHLGAVERFVAELLGRAAPLDVLINNAAQTVRRPPAYYAPLVAAELDGDLPPDARALVAEVSHHERAGLAGGLALPALLTQLPLLPEDHLADPRLFPAPDAAGGAAPTEPLDLRAQNSWRLELGELEPVEAAEVLVVNSLAPLLLVSRLLPALRRSPHPWRFIVNVVGSEGSFAGGRKAPYHVHTNMAKAALNMLTRTEAASLAAEGIALSSVDTGWVSNEQPFPRAELMRAEGFVPPLSAEDAAARVLDPIFEAVSGGAVSHGQLLKDYRPRPW